MSKKWIQKAIQREGRVTDYMKRKYGSKAFTKKGTIRVKYLKVELNRIRKGGVTKREKSLFGAILLALRLRKFRKKKKRRKRRRK